MTLSTEMAMRSPGAVVEVKRPLGVSLQALKDDSFLRFLREQALVETLSVEPSSNSGLSADNNRVLLHLPGNLGGGQGQRRFCHPIDFFPILFPQGEQCLHMIQLVAAFENKERLIKEDFEVEQSKDGEGNENIEKQEKGDIKEDCLNTKEDQDNTKEEKVAR